MKMYNCTKDNKKAVKDGLKDLFELLDDYKDRVFELCLRNVFFALLGFKYDPNKYQTTNFTDFITEYYTVSIEKYFVLDEKYFVDLINKDKNFLASIYHSCLSDFSIYSDIDIKDCDNTYVVSDFEIGKIKEMHDLLYYCQEFAKRNAVTTEAIEFIRRGEKEHEF